MLMQAELVWLLGAVAKGDTAAFERLYGATRAKLYGVLLRILGRARIGRRGHAGDLSQGLEDGGQVRPDAGKPDHLDGGDGAQPRHRYRAQARRVSIEEEPEAQNVAADTPAPLARREMTEELKRLLSCLGKLDPEKQRIVLLAYYSGWSREQLSTKLDIPVNTIKTWLRRSLLEIRECMGLVIGSSDEQDQ